MRKKLSIIVPRFEEKENDIMPLLCSIRSQEGFDFERLEVVISNDNPEEEFQIKNALALGLDIKVINISNGGGPGVARQCGLAEASGEYVMFCDADDCLYNANAIYSLMNNFREFPDTEILYSSWMEEVLHKSSNTMAFIKHEIENTWMHGKVFRMGFLEDNRIAFHPDLRVHEDSYFMAVASRLAAKRRFLTEPCTYLWKWGNDSITRRNDGIYAYETFPTFIRAIGFANKEIMRRIPETDMSYEVAQHLIYCYFTLQEIGWLDESKREFREQSFTALKEEMAPLWDIYNSTPEEMITAIYNEEREKSFSGSVERYSLNDFIKSLE